MRFTRPPTSFEWALAVYLVATLLVAIGVVGLVVAYRAAPEKAGLALMLEIRSLWTLGIGFGVAIVFWVFRRWTG